MASMTSYEFGERVRVRNKNGKWKMGQVTRSGCIPKVKVDGSDKESTWEEIEKYTGEETAKSSSKKKSKPPSKHELCPYWNKCYSCIISKFDSKYFAKKSNSKHRCFCEDCHAERKDDNCYARAGEKYELPLGYVRVVLSTSKVVGKQEFNTVRGYHGASEVDIKKILKAGRLLKRSTLGIKHKDGRWDKSTWRENAYTGKTYYHDVDSVFSSASPKYAEKYAQKSGFLFGVMLKPGTYTKAPETIADRKGFSNNFKPDYVNPTISQYIPNGELEYLTKEEDDITLASLLMKSSKLSSKNKKEKKIEFAAGVDSWKEDFGEKMLKKTPKGEVQEAVPDFSGKSYVGVYFSAHWCPPCRGFTPQLAQAYKDKLKDCMEIVFVSHDRTEKEFGEYYNSMPWCAVQFKSEAMGALKKNFNVTGIPMLVILNTKDGSTKTLEGRSKISECINSKNYEYFTGKKEEKKK